MKSMLCTAAIAAGLALTGAAYAQTPAGAAATVGPQPPSTTAPMAGVQASASNANNPTLTGTAAVKGKRKNPMSAEAAMSGSAPTSADTSTSSNVNAH